MTNRMTHALKMGTPLNAMKTKCGRSLRDPAVADHDIGATLATVTCVPCAAVIEAENKVTRMERGPVPDRLAAYYEWALSGDSGISSKTIVQAITGARVADRWTGVPRDPDDFGRCYRVLRTFPELREKLHLVAEKHPEWTGLVEHWSELEGLYEQALAGSMGHAGELLARMRELRGET